MATEKPKPVIISPEVQARLLSEMSAAAAKQAAKFVTPKEAKGDTGRVPSVDTVPLSGDKTAKKRQDAWIRRMMSDCEGKPELADTLRELSGLLRADADDATLQLLEQTIQKQSKAGGKVLGRRRVTFSVIPDSATPDDLGVKEKDPRLEEFLADIGKGETLVLVRAGGVRKIFTRNDDGFVNSKGATAMGDIVNYLNKGWIREGSVGSAVVAPVSIEKGKEFELPEIGFEALYKDEFGVIIKVIRISDDHYSVFLNKELDDSVSWNTEILEDIARNQKWEPVSITPIKSAEPVEDKPGAIESGVLAAALGAEGASVIEKGEDAPVRDVPVATVESPEKSSIEELKIKVGEMRLEYVTTDYKQGSAWMKVKRFFGKSIGEKPGDADTDSTFERYRLALTNLQEVQLELLRKENLSGPELRERMGKMLNCYKMEERIALTKTRDQVKMESMNGGQTLVTMLEAIGREYNKLPRGAKYTLGGICLATGLLTGGGVIGGGAAAAASTLILLKRLVATTGAAVMVDTGIEQWMDSRKEKSENSEQAQELQELGNIEEAAGQEASFERLQTLIEKDTYLLDTKFKKQKREMLLRRSAVWGVAVAGMVGMGVSWASHLGDSGTPGIEERQREFMRSRSGVVGQDATAPAPAASAPSGAASAPSGVASQAEAPGTGMKPADVVSQPAQVATLSPDKVSIQGRWFLKEHVVTAADGKKGLWGVLQHRLPDDMPKADQNRIVASLENLMRKDLAEMTPAERAAAGFPKGDLDKIYAGKTVIHFDQFKSLTPERIQAILDGQSVGAPSGVAVETAHVSPVNQEAFENKIAALTYQPDMPRDPLAAARAVDVANYDKMGNVREYLSTHPEKIPDFRVSLGHFREEIFLTGDVQKIMDQDYNKYLSLTSPELGKLSVSQITRDYLALRENPFASYDRVRNPLHFSQMQQIDRLLTASGEAYGAIGNQVPAGATIDDLTKRLATLGYQYQTGIPGFLKIKP